MKSRKIVSDFGTQYRRDGDLFGMHYKRRFGIAIKKVDEDNRWYIMIADFEESDEVSLLIGSPNVRLTALKAFHIGIYFIHNEILKLPLKEGRSFIKYDEASNTTH